MISLILKVVTNEKQGGVKKVENDRNWPQTVVLDVLMYFKLAAIFNYFVSFSLTPAESVVQHLAFLNLFMFAAPLH
jgi:hypothetical protein